MMTYKFQPGDLVEIITSGYGCNPNTIGKLVTIESQGKYSDRPGYSIKEKDLATNSKPNDVGNLAYGGMIGEASFVLVKSAQQLAGTTGSVTIPAMAADDRVKTSVNKLNKSIVKTITKKSAQDVRTIETSLINKEEVFKMLALAESTGLPCLLIGEPGVAKTKTVIEYAKAWLNRDGKMSPKDFAEKIYILETDEGTKASEVKGMPDLSKLFTENKYELSTPIADAEIVVINEVDKASSAIRNAMLGVMNEKFLFNGKHKIPCKWKLFIATCNEIPKDEQDSPFWDRFMLKMTVNRVSAGEMVKYYKKGARSYREKFSIGVPSGAEIDQLEIPVNKLEKYLEVGYTHSSDRTLTFVPKLAKAVSYVWDISIDKALVKTAQIMIGQSAGSELQNKLMSPEVKAVMSKVEMLHSYTTNEQLELSIADIESLINTYVTRGIMDETQVEEIELSMQYILANHPARSQATSADFDAMMSEAPHEAVNLPF
jgi:MoxR-like ATPase